MRGLLLVKNTKGEIKFSHYINNERDYESDINFIKEFIQREDKLIALENSLKKTEFFTAKEQSKFLEKLTKENINVSSINIQIFYFWIFFTRLI